MPPSEFQISHQSFIRANEPYFGGELNHEQLSTAGIQVNHLRDRGKSESAIQASAFYSFDEGLPYYNIEQFYYAVESGDHVAAIGRKKHNWSVADQAWETGLWQPQFRWDRLRPEEQGFIGGFWQKDLHKKGRLRAMVSPIFLPDTGVEFEKKKGEFSSANPWFKPPPPTVVVLGEETQVYEYLEMPALSEVVFNPGLAVQYEHQIDESNQATVSYGYKPINQVMNSFKYKLRAAEDGGGVRLEFYPWVAYHHLLTTEHVYKDRYYTNTLSATYEVPTRLMEDDDMVYQDLREAYVLSWLGSYALAGEGDSAFRVFGGYMRFFGGYLPDGGDNFDPGKTQFELRPRFLSVFKAGLSYPVWHTKRRLRNKIEVNYDNILNGGTVLTEVEYAFNKNLFFTTQLDLIGVFETSEDIKKSSFINSYRANDRLQVRLSYVY